ncbi:hypothetical protein J1605_007547 [Eschrichtius robustus]|uniref:Uncharacterized protein n=1 Tax=Eschrichtius robustus TaxID=9764 RepID=A0AB34GWY5_ESCRO|nr:hypothetical protein J1605_007547 [Eschrichtius robustus]
MRRLNRKKTLSLVKELDAFPKVPDSSVETSASGGPGASLVAQWLGIRLPMQGTRVRALVWEDPTCHGATKSMRHNY